MHVDDSQARLLVDSVASGVDHQGQGLGLPKGPHQCTQLSASSVSCACAQLSGFHALCNRG